MHIRQRMILAALFLGAMIFAACGAKQGRHVEVKANWNTLYDAVPADASFSVGHTLNGQGDLPGVLQRGVSLLFDNHFGVILDVFNQNTLRLDGEIVAFSRGDANWLIAEVSDLPRAMESLADGYQDLAETYGEGYTFAQERVGERVVLKVKDHVRSEEAAYVEITGVGNYIIARASTSPDQERVNQDMRALSKGWPESGRYAATGEGAAQRARAGGQELNTWASINMKALNAQIKSQSTGSGLADSIATFGSDEANESEACAMANARLEALIPSIHLIMFTDADGNSHSEAFMRLSNEGVANGRTIMRGAPSLEGFAENALLSIAVSYDFGRFFELRKATPAEAECSGLAGLVGQFTDITNEYANHIKFNARTVTGTGVFVLENLNLEGFIPTANLGVFVESPNAEALFQRIVRAVSKHGSAEVVAKASAPTIEVSLSGMPIRVRIEQGADRVVVTTRGLSEALVSRLLTAVPHVDPNVPFELDLNGEQLRTIRQDAAQYVEEMQIEDGRILEALDVLEERLRGIHAHAVFEENGLRVIVEQEN